MADASVPQKATAVYQRKPVQKLIVIALLAELGYGVMNISTMPVYLANDRQFGTTTIGLVFTAYLLSEAVFKSPMGHLADKFGPKRLMMIGPAISIFTAAISISIPHTGASPLEVLAFIVLRMLDGLGAAMLWPAMFAEVNSVVEDQDRQQAMSLMNLCYMLGIAIAFICGGAINDLTHTTYAGLLLGAVMFATVSFGVYRFVPDVAIPTHVAGEHETNLRDFIDSLKQLPEYLLIAVVTFVGIGFPMAIFKLFAGQQFGYSETQIGFLIGPGAIVLGAASIPMSQFADRIGRIRAIHLGMMMCAAGLTLIGSGAVVPPLRHPYVLAIGCVPVGIGFLMAIPAWFASVSDLDPERRGSNLGAVMTAQGIGAIIGTPVGSTIYEKLQPLGIQLRLGPDFGRYSPFVGSAVCIWIAWAIGLRVLREPKKDKPLTAGTDFSPDSSAAARQAAELETHRPEESA
jgi:DHA1 family multidrug resistance protein-like MFS transporter